MGTGAGGMGGGLVWVYDCGRFWLSTSVAFRGGGCMWRQTTLCLSESHFLTLPRYSTSVSRINLSRVGEEEYQIAYKYLLLN